MAVPQNVQEIVGVKDAARIGAWLRMEVCASTHLVFAFLRADHVCCLSWLGPGGLLLDARDQGLVS